MKFLIKWISVNRYGEVGPEITGLSRYPDYMAAARQVARFKQTWPSNRYYIELA